jgi:hypothetical protein
MPYMQKQRVPKGILSISYARLYLLIFSREWLNITHNNMTISGKNYLSTIKIGRLIIRTTGKEK